MPPPQPGPAISASAARRPAPSRRPRREDPARAHPVPTRPRTILSVDQFDALYEAVETRQCVS